MSKAEYQPGRRLPPDALVVDAIVETLLAEQTAFLSAYPQSSIINAAAARSLRPVLCRQERVGVQIADGFSRTTAGRTPGVFAMQWGPGVENAYSGIATAFADSSPVLFLPLGYWEGKEDFPRFFSAQRLQPIAKSVERIRSPRHVNDVMRRAFSHLRNGRGGPVVVEVPTDVAREQIGPDLDPYRPVKSSRPAGDPQAVDAAVSALISAQRPVILAGQGVLYAEACAELLALAELLDIPVATTLEGKSAFPEGHGLSLGTGASASPAPLVDMMEEADLVLGVGASFTDHSMAISPPVGKMVIHITNDPMDIDKDCQSDYPIIGDAKLVLAGMYECAEERMSPERRGRLSRRYEVQDRKKKWLTEWAPVLKSDARPISHYRVISEMITVLNPDESIVTHDSGSPRDQITPFYEASIPHSYLGWGKSHALGTGLGLIMGAKLARPEKVCVHFLGDAAFGMVGFDFETAVRNSIPILEIVLNNGTMAIETEPLSVAHERYRSRDIGGQYADLGRAMGGWAKRIDHPSEIRPALEEAVRATKDGSAALLEIITSPELTPFSCKRGGSRRRKRAEA